MPTNEAAKEKAKATRTVKPIMVVEDKDGKKLGYTRDSDLTLQYVLDHPGTIVSKVDEFKG